MTSDIERELRVHLAREATKAPALAELQEALAAPVRRHKIRRAGLVAALAGVLIAVPGVTLALRDAAPARDPIAAGPPNQPDQGGPIDAGEGGYCELSYQPFRLAQTEFALAGVVTKVQPPASSSEPYRVTIDVSESFKGGDTEGEMVQVAMAMVSADAESEEIIKAFDTGSILLVSGREGPGIREAWGCGFTRYYDSDTADTWRDQLS